MKVCLLFLCMAMIPVLAGGGVLTVLFRRQAHKFYWTEKLLTGFLVVIGIGEAVHLTAAFGGLSLDLASRIWVLACVACSAAGAVLSVLNRKKEGSAKRKARDFVLTPLRFGILLVFTCLVIGQIMTVTSQFSAYRDGDMMAETVESFLAEGGVYRVNPLTGRAYEAGLPLRIRILGLPTLYAILSHVFGIAPTALLWQWMPLLVLVFSYLAFWLLGETLFDQDVDKRLLFMALAALLFTVQDTAPGLDGFALLHMGSAGTTIRNLILIPMALHLGLRRNWKVAVLVVLAEACITWTLYGMGVSLLVLVGMAICHRLQRHLHSDLHVVEGEV